VIIPRPESTIFLEVKRGLLYYTCEVSNNECNVFPKSGNSEFMKSTALLKFPVQKSEQKGQM
jgi:hypothetical protein